MVSVVSEVKPDTPCCCISKLHVAGTLPGEGMVAETTIGSEAPPTAVMVIGVVGSGAWGTR